jgi:hypothetical protein
MRIERGGYEPITSRTAGQVHTYKGKDGVTRASVRAPLPSIAFPLGLASVSAVGVLACIAAFAMHGEISTLPIMLFNLVFLTGWVFRYRKVKAERERLREANFWRVIDHQINSKLPDMSAPLAKLDAQLERASAGTPPNPNSKRSQRKRERAARRAERERHLDICECRACGGEWDYSLQAQMDYSSFVATTHAIADEIRAVADNGGV